MLPNCLCAILCGIRNKTDRFKLHQGDFAVDRLVINHQNALAGVALPDLRFRIECRFRRS